MAHDLEGHRVDAALRLSVQLQLGRDRELLGRHIAGTHAVEGEAGELVQLLERCVHFFFGSGLYSMVSGIGSLAAAAGGAPLAGAAPGAAGLGFGGGGFAMLFIISAVCFSFCCLATPAWFFSNCRRASSQSLHMKVPVFFCAADICGIACWAQSGASQFAHLVIAAWPHGFLRSNPVSTMQVSMGAF